MYLFMILYKLKLNNITNTCKSMAHGYYYGNSMNEYQQQSRKRMVYHICFECYKGTDLLAVQMDIYRNKIHLCEFQWENLQSA